MFLKKSLSLAGTVCIMMFAGCGAEGSYPGLEYAPNMYHSVSYEPLSQITDEDAGAWVTSIEYNDGHSEYYNSNRFNPHGMNMRQPPPFTVERNKKGWLPYRIPKDSLATAARMTTPFEATPAVLADGKVLYDRYCEHCHGPKGQGDGKVAAGVTVEGVEKGTYNGVANLTSDLLKNISEGHIFHVITHGKGLMWPHESQISPEDRWKIAAYVKTLQK